MPRKYSHVQEYEKAIFEMRDQGMTWREIGEKLGFSKSQMKQLMAGGGVALIGTTLIPLLSGLFG